MENSNKKEIVIIYPGFPHYRKGIIDELEKSTSFNYTFIGDPMMMKTDIKSHNFSENSFHFSCPSYQIGPIVFHRKMIKYILKNDFDGYIFHVSPYWITILICVLIAKLKKKPVLNWTHGILQKSSLKNHFYTGFFKYFDGNLLYSNRAMNNMIEMGIETEKLHVIYNSLDYNNQIKFRDSLTYDQLKEFRQGFFLNPNNPQLIFIGRLTKIKNLKLIIEALSILNEKGHFFNFLIIGEGEEKASLLKEIQIRDLKEQVYFYGDSYDEKENYKLIASSDCCVSPGNAGLIAIHSLMYGTPVITHDKFDQQMPECESITPGYNGMFFKYDDGQNLADIILEWFAKNKNREEIRKNCYKIIDNIFNPANQTALIEQALNIHLNSKIK
jgi:glycosyltransferase involved in cell wall biosynthesis